VFDVAPGGDTITFGNTNNGGDGHNTILFGIGDGNVDVSLNGGSGTVQFGAGISASNLLLQANSTGDLILKIRGDDADSITVHSDLVHYYWGVSSGISQIGFADGTTMALAPTPTTFTWVGTSTNTTLVGSNFGANIFEFGAGSETATGGRTDNGGSGNNTYKASTATGQATIVANESAGTSNELDFTGGITDNQLWFLQSGNDLRIDLVGTQTEVSIKNWFSGGGNQLQEITAGGLKIDNQISQLVQAMATYSANNPGFDPTAATVQSLPNDGALQTSLAAAWHA
jgi:hypothetical protein